MDKEVKDFVDDLDLEMVDDLGEEDISDDLLGVEAKSELGVRSALSPLVDVSEIPIEITAVLGDTEMKLSELMELGKGSFIELNTYEDNNVKLLANGKLIAYGIVLAVDQNFGVQITKIVR